MPVDPDDIIEVAPTATSSASIALAGARHLIATSSTMSARTNLYHGDGTDESIVSGHIYYNDVFDPTTPIKDLWPFVVLSLATHDYESLVNCSVPALVLNGGILVAFFDKPRFVNSDYAYLDFCNWVFGVCDDMDGQFSNDTNYPFSSIEPAVNPERTDQLKRQSDADDYLLAAVIFNHERK